MTLVPRVTANISNVITNISTVRFDNFTEQWGGYSNTTTDAPNWGAMVWATVSVYPDFMGQMAWLILFIIPFLMMWVAFNDLFPVAIIGIFFGAYIFNFVGYEWQGLGILFIGLSITGVLWGLWQK